MATAALAKAIGSRVGAELGGSLVKGAKVRILGDPEQKALQRALQRAFSQVQDEFGDRLAAFDVNDGFWVHEGAAELALVLVPGVGRRRSGWLSGWWTRWAGRCRRMTDLIG
ncbi:hypothetical protein GCM10027605_74310 [Micromonospora zhanjiangensis]